ncbi:MAG: type II toxin-antitoxin system VapC family toxin [Chloroflexi bacterium]|nr:type II toxin-antitoxin system VapC family toxin [Chloroflexota bacterium]MCC6896672.1 type II toxin-antitoxin system VapC family toxin [Anaerolineae bacterium]
MSIAVADTHAIIWFLSNDKRLSIKAKQFMDEAEKLGDKIAVSSISFVEMVYLIEKGKIPSSLFSQLVREIHHPDSVFVEIPVTTAVSRAMSKVSSLEVPDMPDRIVTATAVELNVPVISRDGKIRLSSIATIW